MVLGLRVSVAGWAGWIGPGEEMVLGGALSERPPLPASLRRRVTAIGRKALEAAWAVLPTDGAPRLVLASRHGEYTRTFGLLVSLDQDGEVSPAEFSLAVHHALAGLLSIATGNREGHTAVSAGRDSFGYGLLEAATFVAEQSIPALLFYYDEPLPTEYVPVVAHDFTVPMVLAMLLVPSSWPQTHSVEVSLETLTDIEGECLAQTFLEVLQNGGEAVGQGGRHAWRWRHAD